MVKINESHYLISQHVRISPKILVNYPVGIIILSAVPRRREMSSSIYEIINLVTSSRFRCIFKNLISILKTWSNNSDTVHSLSELVLRVNRKIDMTPGNVQG